MVQLLIIIISSQVSAQSAIRYSDFSVVFKSDTNSRSVLVSNLFEDRVGDQSPFIGTATWFDKGKQLQCRSYIAFNYGIIPWIIKPEQISNAELILNPVQLGDPAERNEARVTNFIVRRVLQPWQDSMTSWLNQPTANLKDQVIKQVPIRKQDRTVRVDVTEMVRNMFRFGNNGFMIGYQDSLENALTISQWFASARNENEKIRPMLLIRYSIPNTFEFTQMEPPLPMLSMDRMELLEMYLRPEPTNPVKEPVKAPVKD